jgi:hypothetical protein
MSAIERRLLKVEGHALVGKPAPTMAEMDARINELLGKLGMSRDGVIAHYGSMQGFLKALRATDEVRQSGQGARHG